MSEIQPEPGESSPPRSPPPPPTVRPLPVAVAVVAVLGALGIGVLIGQRGGPPAAQEPASHEDGHAGHDYYTCGMHPWVVLPRPGTCPICAMDLVLLDPAKFTGEVTIDPVVVQNIGVRVAEVVRAPAVQTLRTVGTIEYDETRVRDVNVKVGGWVHELHVDELGQPVQKGQPLFEIYSPELYSAQKEYLLALKQGEAGRELVDAARTKLEYLDVPASEIAALRDRGEPRKTLTLRIPYTGVVTEKKVVEGMRLDPGMPVLQIADLSRIWVMATLHEYQLPHVQVGQAARVTLPYLPDRTLEGKVVYVYPYLDSMARQAQVRIELPNPKLALKPGMYATVELEGSLGGDRVLAPREAVIDTGARKVAFVSKGGGHFEPRQVRTGIEADGGRVEILEGLEPGEQVVTSGQFSWASAPGPALPDVRRQGRRRLAAARGRGAQPLLRELDARLLRRPQRVLESLSFVAGKLPAGVRPQLGPDATGVGWVYEYVLVTEPGSGVDLARLRGLQDWYLRYGLTAVDGVSEVATVGGFVKQYQVVVDPVKLLAFRVSLHEVKEALERSNSDTGGSVLELGETEFMVRGLGYLGTLDARDLEEARRSGEPLDRVRTGKVLAELRKVALGATPEGSPIHLSDVAEVHVGPEMRSGLADWNGLGETVGGVVVMRSGENARETIARVKEKLASLEKGLPPGVKIEPAYDRSDLIDRAVGTLQRTLFEEILVVSLICVVFLLHARSALVAAFVLPTGVLATPALMKLLGINANIMSLGGIAIAIGVMVDSSIIMVENAHKHLEYERRRRERGEHPRPRSEVITEAAVEVGPSLFFALLIIVVSFLPIFVLGEQSGRLFKPLAWTKTFAMGAGALLAVTIIPVLMVFFVSERVLPASIPRRRQIAVVVAGIALPALLLALVPLGALAPWRFWLAGGWAVLSALVLLPQRIPSEQHNPVSRFLEVIYDPLFSFVMRYRALTLVAAAALVIASIYPLKHLGSEFMPPLEEGDLLYMPTTDPGIGMGKVRELLQQTDALIKQFPEVESVFGKAGRAETATDPAPPSMFETTITLHRDRDRWRHTVIPRFFSGWPAFLKAPLALVWPETRPITVQELVHGYTLPGPGKPLHVPGLDEVLQIPGLTNSWTMPIRTRIDMLSTGIKTPVGVKVMGPDLEVIAGIGAQIAQTLRTDARTGPHTVSAFAEKSVGATTWTCASIATRSRGTGSWWATCRT